MFYITEIEDHIRVSPEYFALPVNEAIVQHQIIDRREDTSPPSVSGFDFSSNYTNGGISSFKGSAAAGSFSIDGS